MAPALAVLTSNDLSGKSSHHTIRTLRQLMERPRCWGTEVWPAASKELCCVTWGSLEGDPPVLEPLERLQPQPAAQSHSPERPWVRTSQLSHPDPQKWWYIDVCYFKLLNLGVTCYIAKENQYKLCVWTTGPMEFLFTEMGKNVEETDLGKKTED